MKTYLRKIIYIFPLVGIICLGLFGYAYFIEPKRLVINYSTIKIKNWNPAFEGLKIVMIGDIHGGSHYVDAEKIRQVVARSNEQDADLVVLLGDYVSQTGERQPGVKRGVKMAMETVAENLSGLRAKYGVFAVLGNHDGAYSDECVATALTGLGYKVLQDEVAVVDINSQRLRLLGFKDHLELTKGWQGTSDDAKALLAASGDGDVIALEHSPDIMPVITGGLSISNDLRLVLAAHTHGGQVWLPIFGRAIVPSTFGQKYAYGHVRENDVDLFVTSGVGMSVLPVRFMVPPEIAVLTIRMQEN